MGSNLVATIAHIKKPVILNYWQGSNSLILEGKQNKILIMLLLNVFPGNGDITKFLHLVISLSSL